MGVVFARSVVMGFRNLASTKAGLSAEGSKAQLFGWSTLFFRFFFGGSPVVDGFKGTPKGKPGASNS